MKNTQCRILAKLLVISFSVLLIGGSCAPAKRSAYFRINETIENPDQPDQSYEQSRDSLHIIQPGDELYITVTTADNEPHNFQIQQSGVLGIEMLSYLVDRDGFVELPYIGKLKLSELNVDEATKLVRSELSQYLYQPIVTIKMVNARITVLGEVAAPGVYIMNNKPMNIYQAIGYAGDITEFGNKTNVLIVREDHDSVLKKYVNLTNDQVLGTEWYTLQANDIIYVEPLQRRQWGMATFPWTLISSLISTTILIMTFIITLNN